MRPTELLKEEHQGVKLALGFAPGRETGLPAARGRGMKRMPPTWLSYSISSRSSSTSVTMPRKRRFFSRHCWTRACPAKEGRTRLCSRNTRQAESWYPTCTPPWQTTVPARRAQATPSPGRERLRAASHRSHRKGGQGFPSRSRPELSKRSSLSKRSELA